jgi:hypothetical protein
MNKRGLKSKISKKLDQLQDLLGEMDEVQVINSDDPETWDNDTLYNLVEQLKKALKILEDQPIKDAYDEFNEPLYEDGLCSLIDIYQEETNEDYDE